MTLSLYVNLICMRVGSIIWLELCLVPSNDLFLLGIFWQPSHQHPVVMIDSNQKYNLQKSCPKAALNHISCVLPSAMYGRYILRSSASDLFLMYVRSVKFIMIWCVVWTVRPKWSYVGWLICKPVTMIMGQSFGWLDEGLDLSLLWWVSTNELLTRRQKHKNGLLSSSHLSQSVWTTMCQ